MQTIQLVIVGPLEEGELLVTLTKSVDGRTVHSAFYSYFPEWNVARTRTANGIDKGVDLDAVCDIANALEALPPLFDTGAKLGAEF